MTSPDLSTYFDSEKNTITLTKEIGIKVLMILKGKNIFSDIIENISINDDTTKILRDAATYIENNNNSIAKKLGMWNNVNLWLIRKTLREDINKEFNLNLKQGFLKEWNLVIQG